jgi:hypothetical protein
LSPFLKEYFSENFSVFGFDREGKLEARELEKLKHLKFAS